MDDEQLQKTVPQLGWFLGLSLVPWPLFLFNNDLHLPMWLAMFSIISILTTPVASLWFTIPVAKLTKKSIGWVVLITLTLPFAYLVAGIWLLRAASHPVAIPQATLQ